MNASLSRWLLSRLERRTPEWVRRLEIQALLDLAARSFGREGKSVRRLPAEKALEAYAAYTAACMEKAEADSECLYQSAYRLGQRLRRVSGFTEDGDLKRLVFYLYRNIGITMQGSLPGQLTISACFFSRFYTPEQCRTMSSVDEGIIAGLLGGGTLQFTERLTENCGRCSACFRRGSGNP